MLSESSIQEAKSLISRIWFVIFLISALSIIFNSTQNGFLEMKSGMLILFQKRLTGMTTCLNPEIFAAADLRWGPHSIDRFSSFKTRQVPRFCSRWLNPLMEYLDAFTASWQNENNWLFPPPYLIPKVLKHLEFSKAAGTLVAPMWTSAIWWPLLT